MHPHPIDTHRADARNMVDKLHRVADAFEANAIKAAGTDITRYKEAKAMAAFLADAACMLDQYQAGLSLATPNPATGYKLVPIDQPATMIEVAA
jgi:hypothetical protein